MRDSGTAIAPAILALSAVLLGIGIDTARIARSTRRLADTADLQLCIEAIRVGVDPVTLPPPCSDLQKARR